MSKILVKSHFGKLVPVDTMSEEAIRRAPKGQFYLVELKGTRNLKHHQKFRVLLDLIWRNQEEYPSVDIMHSAIKYELGHCDTFMRDGKIIMTPKSTSFASMGQVEFSEYYDKVINMVCTHIIPGLSEGDLRQELEELTRDAD